MSEIEVTVAEEGMTYVFPNDAAVEAWSLHGVPAYVRTRHADAEAIEASVQAVNDEFEEQS